MIFVLSNTKREFDEYLFHKRIKRNNKEYIFISAQQMRSLDKMRGAGFGHTLIKLNNYNHYKTNVSWMVGELAHHFKMNIKHDQY